MKNRTLALLIASLLCGTIVVHAQEMQPQKEHKWLEQFAGEWDFEVEIVMQPGQPPIKAKGTDSGRMVGGFWVTVEGKAEMMGMPFLSRLTLGYDPTKKKYIGTWIDSMSSYLWKYEGTVDATGQILTLETEGPNPMKPETVSKFKEVTEFKSKDHRVFTSSILGDDGKWTTMVTANSRRKK